MELELVIFVGLQASGKSTFHRERFASTHVLVSKDLMRSRKRREERQRRLVEEALALGRPVVVDNTNPAASDRAALISIARARGARVIGYWFDAGLDECMERNERRAGPGRVPAIAIHATARRLERPRQAEGFDSVYVVRLEPDGGWSVRPYVPADESA
jgi:predicted kinase